MEGLVWTYQHLASAEDIEPPFKPQAIAIAPLALLLFLCVSPQLSHAYGRPCPPSAWRSRPVAAAVPYTPAGISTTDLQQRLKALGYFPTYVGATGYYGEITTEAVRAFQRDRGLWVDGLAGPVTVNALLDYPSKPSTSVAASPTPQASVTYTPASTIDPASTMTQLGDVGAAVAAQKVRLNEFGYTAGTGDRFDDKMEFAVRRFQEDKGLKVTGKIGDRTNQILFAPENGLPPVEPGDANTLVQLVQERLGLLPTGAFDEDTQQAVKSFQAERGLPTTGVVSRQTHRELKTWLGRLAVVNEILGQPQL